jgi:c-di-GMP-binding flagellar brake protein YcgR
VLTDHSKERRTFMRMVVDAPVTVIHNERRLAGICRDLSANGMSIEVEEGGIEEGDELLVSLATSSNLLPPFQAQARVMRVAPYNAVYRLGVEFVSVV